MEGARYRTAIVPSPRVHLISETRLTRVPTSRPFPEGFPAGCQAGSIIVHENVGDVGTSLTLTIPR